MLMNTNMKEFMQLTVRQQEIIDAALALIAEQGIQNLTIKNIAAALKITEPAIYRHFDSKFAILDALLDSFDHGSVSVLADSAANQRSPLERIEAFVLDRYRRVKERPYLSKVMFSGELFLFDERLSGKMLAMMHRHKTRISALIEEGQARGEIRNDVSPHSLCRMIFGSLRLLIYQWGMSGYRFDLPAEGLELWQDLRKMLRK